MVRAFTGAPVDPDVVDGLIDLARRAPSAGNSQGVASSCWRVPSRPPLLGRRAAGRDADGFGFPGLVTAPVLFWRSVRADTWIERYAEPDKATHGLGAGTAPGPCRTGGSTGGWPWSTSSSARSMPGLGACFFGLFDHEPAVFAELGVPEGWRALGTIALGHPAPDEPGLSAAPAAPHRRRGPPPRRLVTGPQPVSERVVLRCTSPTGSLGLRPA